MASALPFNACAFAGRFPARPRLSGSVFTMFRQILTPLLGLLGLMALATGALNEIEPFPEGEVVVPRGGVIDCCRWSHALPRSVK